MTLRHCAGHRNSKDELENGAHSLPSSPHPLPEGQYVAVQPMDDEAGVLNDCAREKNAKAIIYPAERTSRSHGFESGFVKLAIHDSTGSFIRFPNLYVLISSNGMGADDKTWFNAFQEKWANGITNMVNLLSDEAPSSIICIA